MLHYHDNLAVDVIDRFPGLPGWGRSAHGWPGNRLIEQGSRPDERPGCAEARDEQWRRGALELW